MSQRRFSLEDQQAFAGLSGDWNPLHVDPAYARRCLYGKIVVHGVYAVLWALDAWLADHRKPIGIRNINVEFLRPIGLETPVACEVRMGSDRRVVMTLECEGDAAVRLELEWQDGIPAATALPSTVSPRRAPRDLDPREMDRQAGSLELSLDKEAAGMFPHLAQFLGSVDTATLLATTRLVGMECPGLYSVFSELSLAAASSGPAAGTGKLDYEVTSVDRRFGLVILKVTAPGLAGTVKAFIRPKPHNQADYATVRRAVIPGEFAGQRALIIGGSRGLGELAAKIVAAAGGSVRITHFCGKADAGRVVEEITTGGGQADGVPLDVLDESGGTLDALATWRPTHLYYFATPFIFAGRRGRFSGALLDQFSRYYVTAFARVMESLKDAGLCGAFYPSSVALDEPPPDMREYVAAKTAGEALCTDLERSRPRTPIFRPRLPRLATDQTMSLVQVHNQDPLPVMLTLLRSFQSLTATGSPKQAVSLTP